MRRKDFIKTFLFSLFSMLPLVFLSCSEIANETVKLSNIPQEEYEVPVFINQDSSRTIKASPYTIANITSYRLTGMSQFGVSIDESYTAAQINNGSVVLHLSSTIWQLQLEALIGGETVAFDRKSVDFSNGSYPVTFSLSSETLRGNGQVAIKVKYSDSLIVDSATVGIYNIISGNPIVEESYNRDQLSIENPFLFDKGDIPSGSYLFKVKFFTRDKKECGFYSESILIEQGKTIRTQIDLGQVIGNVPIPPANFHAYYVEGSESADGETYQVKFEWDDRSDNESYFQIVFYHGMNEGALSSQYFIISGMTNESENIYSLYDCPPQYLTAVSGSTFAGNTEFTATLKTGHFYEVKIAAVNNIGSSAYMERTAGTNKPGLVAFGKSSYIGVGGYNATQSINRIRVIYDLKGGSLYTSAGPPSTNNIIQYYIAGLENPSLYELNRYVNEETDKPYLLKDGRSWSHWATSENGSAMTNSDFSHQNQVIHAVYEGGG